MALAQHGLVACVKAALQLQGFDVGGPIAPQEPLRGEALEEIRKALTTIAADER